MRSFILREKAFFIITFILIFSLLFLLIRSRAIQQEGSNIIIMEQQDDESSFIDAAAEVLQLPPSDPSVEETIPTLKVGETMRFEELGPVIINKDGKCLSVTYRFLHEIEMSY